MKWFFKWFAEKTQEALNVSKESNEVYAIAESPRIDRDHMFSRGMNFTVYRANGGYVIEHRTYNPKTDRHDNSLHIITEGKDLGEEIGKIITFESIRS